MARQQRDYLSALIGLVVFLVGVGMIVVAFKFAFDLFQVPHAEAIGVAGDKEINLNATLGSMTTLIAKILILIAMAGFGSMIANRGIKFYASGGQSAERRLSSVEASDQE